MVNILEIDIEVIDIEVILSLSSFKSCCRCKLELSRDFSRLLSMNNNLRHKAQTAVKSTRPRKLRDGESSADNFIAQLNADVSFISFCFLVS